MRTARTQSGMTAVGIMMVLLLVGLVTLVGLKLLPVYIEHFQIKSVLKSLKNDRELSKQPPQEVWHTMSKLMGVNDIKAITKENVDIQKSTTGIHVVVDYETRKGLMGNVDLVASFHEEVDIP